MNKSAQTMKNCILYAWRPKIGYPLGYDDFEELEKIIDYYEDKNKYSKNQLEQKDKTIDECIELVENSDEYLLLLESHLKYEGHILSRILEKLQQVKGDCDE